MTDQSAALALDRALDGERGFDLNGSESLLVTARVTQSLFDRQRQLPSEDFIMQLERLLFSAPTFASDADGPHILAVHRPQTTPRLEPTQPTRVRRFQRWIAFAAALALILGGSGAYLFGMFGDHSGPEPSVIPAAMLGTAAATPAPEVANWTVAPPEGSTRLITKGLVSNGRIFAIFAKDDDTTTVQAVDQRTGQVLWDRPLGNWQSLLAATAGDLLLATATDDDGSTLTAYDGSTGSERWQTELGERPVGLLVQDDRILVLGSGNGLEALDMNEQPLWRADLSQFDETAADDSGMNKYFNLTGSRLAATDGVVGAIVSNGRLVGVDATDGSVKWASERTTNAATTVMVADGKFVVAAHGSDMQGYDYDGAAGTPIPETDRCEAAIMPRTGSTPGAIRANGDGADSFDPLTGESPWGIETNRPAWIWPLDEANLIAMVSPGWDTVNDQPQNIFPCKIDGATGAISDLDGSSLADIVIDINNDRPTGMAGFPDGGTFVIPDIDSTVAATLPHIESQGSDSGSASWLQSVDGRILVVLTDGTLMSMPANSQSSAATATPAVEPATPVPSGAAWEVDAPDGDKSYFLTLPSIVDGVMYRMLGTSSGPGHIQAIDVTDGSILWDIVSPVNSTINAVNSSVFLVAGAESDSPTSTDALVALDAGSGTEQWRVSIDTFPVGLLIADNHAFVLSNGNVLEAFDLDTQQLVWREDLSSFMTEPVDRSVPIYTEGRLAAIDGTIAAVLRNGRIVALDSADGSVRWSDERTNDGQTNVGVAGGRFVVTAVGKVTMEVGKDPYSVPPSPVAGYDPKTQPCQRTLAPPGSSTTAAVGENGEAIDSFDPQTGDSPWGLRTHAAVWVYPVDDTSLIAFIRPGWDSVIGNEDFGIYCRIDGATGAFAETSGVEFVDFVMSSADGTPPIGIGDLGEGIPLFVNIDSETAQTLPVFDKELGPTTGFFRIQEDDGFILISLSNGMLYGLPKDGPRWIPVDPDATPTIWSVGPPEGSDGSNSTSPIVAGDVSVRIVPPQEGLDASHIQTVDLKTGSVLWEIEAPVDPTAMVTSDDLVLVGGPAGDTSDASGLIVALDLRTGAERWRITTKEPPVELLVADGNLLALGNNDYLQGFDLEHQWITFETDLGLYDEDGAPANALTGHRLAELDGWVAAITSTGALIQVDASGGSWLGVQLGDPAATTSLDVIDDRFVLVRTGADTTGGAALESDLSPLASPTAGFSTCQQVIVNRSGTMPDALAANDQELSSFEPGVTEQHWGVSMDAAIRVFPLDDDDLVAVLPSTAHSANATYCRIDGDTGKGSQVGDLVPDFVYSDSETGVTSGMLVLSNGSGLPMDVGPEIAQALPFFDVDAHGAITWVQAIDGGYLITTSTGNLVFLPELR